MMELTFWLSLAALGYTFVGYPALVWWLARVRPRPVRRERIEPPVTVLIAAHNEGDKIAARIENCLALDYRPDRLEIVVASDGSTDATVEVARRYERPGVPGPAVRVLPYAWRRGKPSVLNDSIPACRGAIVVLGDARQRYAPDVVRRLVENFADHEVGAASGELLLDNDAGAPVGDGVGTYWRYEKLIRRSESTLHSTVGATGAIYAVRRKLFEPIPDDSLDDDVIIPVRIARRGYRVVFDARARAWDRAATSAQEEYTRKVRTIAGIVQLFARERWLLCPTHRLWLPAVSHKLLRLAAPFFMLSTLLSGAVLAGHGTVYLTAFTGQMGLYGAALGGGLLRNHRSRLARCLGVPYMFCLLNSTTLIALCRSATGWQSVQWAKATDTAAQTKTA
jgi:cellulose synthase/poly-beta-1,6-N-acetylglucosamine synthase-like glycosyltransferase